MLGTKIKRLHRWLCLCLICASIHCLYAQTTNEFIVGGLINDYVARKTWGPYWKSSSPLHVMRENGFGWAATWVLIRSSPYLSNTVPAEWSRLPWRDEYWCSLEYATEFCREAQKEGLRLHVLLVLSDKPTFPCHQDIPTQWQGLSDAKLATAVERYCTDTASHFARIGLNVELYSIGNEIEFGILNTTPGRSCVPPGIDVFSNIAYLRSEVWPQEARLLKAAIQGVKKVHPAAKIALHPNSVGRSVNNAHLRAFLTAMVQAGVQFDFVSITDPQVTAVLVEGTRPYWGSKQFQSLVKFVGALQKKVLVGEVLYPHSTGRITSPPDPGYPYTPEGQRKWVSDFLAVLKSERNVAGVFYWYPDYFPGYSGAMGNPEEHTGLFVDDSHSQPAMMEFRRFIYLDKH